MRKYEVQYQLEQMTSTVDRLSDVLGKQSHHIAELWEEIRIKQDLLVEQKKKINRYLTMIDAYRRKIHSEEVEGADLEKRFRESVGESVDN